MAAGNHTFINTLLALNNFKNIFLERESRYPEVPLEDLNKADLIMLSSEPYPFSEKHILELKDIVDEKKLRLVDGEYFSWYGSRLVKDFEYFKSFNKELFQS